MILQSAYTLVKETGIKFSKDKAPRLGAALAFYTALSLAPMLLVVIGIAGAVYGQQVAEGQLDQQLKEAMGPDGAKAAKSMLDAKKSSSNGTISAVIGLITLVVAATTLFAQMQDSLNAVWRVESKQTESKGFLSMVWEMVRDRLLSLAAVGGVAFLLLVSTVFGSIVTGLGDRVTSVLPFSDVWLRLVNITLSVVLTAVMFAMIFKLLPEARVAWSDVWIGAAVTAVLFGVGKFAITTYLGKMSVGSSYGAAGSFMVLLIWVYYSTQIMLFGACFTHIYATRFGSGIKTPGGKPIGDGVTGTEDQVSEPGDAAAGDPKLVKENLGKAGTRPA